MLFPNTSSHIRLASESLPTLIRIEKRLNSLQNTDDPNLRTLYLAISNDVDELKKEIHDGYKTGLDQRSVGKIVDRYNSILQFPLNFLSESARRVSFYKDIDDWDPIEFKNVDQQWKEHRDKRGVLVFLPNYVTWYRKNQLQPKDWFDHEFIIQGKETETTGFPFFFEYTYVFRDSYIPVGEMIRSRESGKVYIGVSDTMRLDYDGQIGTARAFTQHDFFHAFFQKYKDNKLFSSLGINDIRTAESVRALNAEKLDILLNEWETLENPKLKFAVRALLFALVHEQANSYPLQVHEDLSDPVKRKFYQDRLPVNLRGENSVDTKASRLTKSEEEESVRIAIEWLAPKVETHAQQVREALKTVIGK